MPVLTSEVLRTGNAFVDLVKVLDSILCASKMYLPRQAPLVTPAPVSAVLPVTGTCVHATYKTNGASTAQQDVDNTFED